MAGLGTGSRGKALNMAYGPRFGVNLPFGTADCQEPSEDLSGSSSRPTLSRPVAVRWRGRTIGHVADGVFVRRLQAAHVLRTPPALALHVEVLDELDRLGVEVVEFHMPDGAILTGPLSLYRGPRSFEPGRGWGPQRAVLLADFARVELRQATIADVRAFGDGDGE